MRPWSAGVGAGERERLGDGVFRVGGERDRAGEAEDDVP